jgi:hypothetical protein
MQTLKMRNDAPHTSAHDFYLSGGSLEVWVRNELCRKKELFVFPLGYYFKYMEENR